MMTVPAAVLCLAVLDVAVTWVLSAALELWGAGPLLVVWVCSVLRLGLLSACLRLVRCLVPGLTSGRLRDLRLGLATCCLLLPTYTSLSVVAWSPSAELLHGSCTPPVLALSYLVTGLGFTVGQRFLPELGGAVAPGQTPSLSRLVSCLRPDSGRFLLVTLFLVLSSAGEMAIPYYSGRMTDWVMNEDNPSAFSSTILAMAAFTIGSAVSEFICDCIYNATMTGIHTRIQGSVFRSVVRQEIAFFDTQHTGDITSRITTDTNTMSDSLTEQLSLLMWYLMRAAFLLVFMLGLSSKLSLLTLALIPFIIIVPEFFAQFYQELTAKVQASLARANDVAMETFSSMRTVRSFANEDGECRRYADRLHDTFQLNKREALLYAVYMWTNSLSGLLLKVSILCYGGFLVADGGVTSGGLVSFILYQMQFTSAIEALLHVYPHVKKAVGASEKVFEYMDRKPALVPVGGLSPTRLKAHIEFRNVTFAYPKQPDVPVLKNVSFEVRSGEVTALVGPSGGGKTTCVSLLQRFYQPQSGQILLDGKPIEEYEHKYYHSKVALVSQEPVLFARSVEENIAYGLESSTAECVVGAARRAGAHGFVTALKDGYSTDAGERGGQLSGGQKQRVAIARALIREPRVLILDDATSCLDNETEHLVHQSVYSRAAERAVLVIAHRPSTMERADRVVVLEGGAVVEEGSPQELQERGGTYHRLLHTHGPASGSGSPGGAEREP
ncbi:antigen peptide transporter 1 [Pristis pectinata]|uniref:antigen peptide transporter 1 n=1 Tax=Pristis pectinata TaxID=685728 RepID=UPI00223E65C8|nr:antigen peptide transporter 1 [Pristis pectinata]